MTMDFADDSDNELMCIDEYCGEKGGYKLFDNSKDVYSASQDKYTLALPVTDESEKRVVDVSPVVTVADGSTSINMVAEEHVEMVIDSENPQQNRNITGVGNKIDFRTLINDTFFGSTISNYGDNGSSGSVYNNDKIVSNNLKMDNSKSNSTVLSTVEVTTKECSNLRHKKSELQHKNGIILAGEDVRGNCLSSNDKQIHNDETESKAYESNNENLSDTPDSSSNLSIENCFNLNQNSLDNNHKLSSHEHINPFQNINTADSSLSNIPTSHSMSLCESEDGNRKSPNFEKDAIHSIQNKQGTPASLSMVVSDNIVQCDDNANNESCNLIDNTNTNVETCGQNADANDKSDNLNIEREVQTSDKSSTSSHKTGAKNNEGDQINLDDNNLESGNTEINVNTRDICENNDIITIDDNDHDDTCVSISDDDDDDCCIIADNSTENIRVLDTFSLRTDQHTTDDSCNESECIPSDEGSSKRNSPVSDVLRNSPVSDTQRNSPVVDDQSNSPVLDAQGNSPVSDDQRNSPVSDDQRNSPSINVDIESPRLDVQHCLPLSNIHSHSPSSNVKGRTSNTDFCRTSVLNNCENSPVDEPIVIDDEQVEITKQGSTGRNTPMISDINAERDVTAPILCEVSGELVGDISDMNTQDLTDITTDFQCDITTPAISDLTDCMDDTAGNLVIDISASALASMELTSNEASNLHPQTESNLTTNESNLITESTQSLVELSEALGRDITTPAIRKVTTETRTPNTTLSANTSKSVIINILSKPMINNVTSSIGTDHLDTQLQNASPENCHMVDDDEDEDYYILPQMVMDKSYVVCKKVLKSNKDENLTFHNVMLMSVAKWMLKFKRSTEYHQYFSDSYESVKNQLYTKLSDSSDPCNKYLFDVKTRAKTVIEKGRICPECGFCFENQKAQRSHMRIHHSEVLKTMPKVPRVMKPRKSATMPRAGTETPGVFLCEQCSTVCTSKVNLEFHIQLRHKKDAWIGSNDLEKMLTSDSRQACPRLPVEITEPGDTSSPTPKSISSVYCPECGSKFSNKSKLLRHFYKEHGRLLEECNVLCDICKKVFSNNKSLSLHRRHHKSLAKDDQSKEKVQKLKSQTEVPEEEALIIKCLDCNKQFKAMKYLKKHIKSCHSSKNAKGPVNISQSSHAFGTETYGLYKCSKCAAPRFFDSIAKLRNHEIGHSYSGISKSVVEID